MSIYQKVQTYTSSLKLRPKIKLHTTSPYVNGYWGNFGAKIHFCLRNALRTPQNPPPQQWGKLGACDSVVV
jgi:hypothetical protein